MANPIAVRDEPVTPAGRLFLRPEMNLIIHCIIGAVNPFDINAFKSEIAASAIMKHPRFSSLLVTDHNGLEHWRRTEIDIDRHFIVVRDPVGEVDGEEAVNDYVADLAVSTPLAVDKPLWEFHLLMAHNCAVIRIHHALGDGISLMSLLLTICRKANDPSQLPTMTFVTAPSLARRSHGAKGVGGSVVRIFKAIWYTLVFVLGFMLRGMWVSDPRTAVSGGDGVELWPRKLVTARFQLAHMKAVKQMVAGATINDVLFGVISSGLSKYLDIRTPEGLPEGLQMTGLAMVNLRKQPGLQGLEKLMSGSEGSSWGNKFGMMLLPVYYYRASSDPLQYVKRAKEMIDKKKLSLEAHFSYLFGDLIMSILGVKAACWLNYRVACNTTFSTSNVVGPQEDITLAGNLIKYLRVTCGGLPHAITMHMVSYAGRAEMQILVAKDVVPDPKILAKCFEDALLEMKEAAEALKRV